MIKEVIVVEGRDDITAVKKAVDAEMIAVGGFGINNKVIDKIKEAQKRQGVIVFTDPDYAGEKIRKLIANNVKGIKHAYISREEGTKDDNIGVENAKPDAIIKALNNAKCEVKEVRSEFNMNDMVFFKLVGSKESKKRRELLGIKLGIGYGNANQILMRLNNYGITKEEFIDAIESIDMEDK